MTSIDIGADVITTSLGAGSRIHLWIKAARAGIAADVFVTDGSGSVQRVTEAGSDDFAFFDVGVSGGTVRLSHDPATTVLSLAYAFHADDVMSEGCRLLYIRTENAAPALPHSYHFRPPFGWMNDPNGFGRYGGAVHLFYQHYPHSRRWNAMHWGHAVSDDFVRWRHLPVYLFPEQAVYTEAKGRGGCFSGTGIATGDGFRIFYTDHLTGRLPEEQVQYSVASSDPLVAGEPVLLVGQRPEGLSLTTDFRDPYVVMGPDGRWKMLLGSRDPDGGVILLYETDDPEAAGGWRFIDVLHRENRMGMTAVECPAMLPLNGPPEDPETRWGLIFGLLASLDPATGRRNITTITVGRFDGRRFTAEFEQELDFATDAYGFQPFYDRDGPVGIAWVANWVDVDPNADYPSAMTLPRRVILDNGAVRTPPVDAVKSLRRLPLDGEGLARGSRVNLGTGAVEIRLTLSEAGAAFGLDLDLAGYRLGVAQDGAGLAIMYQPDGAPATPRYIALGARASTVDIFIDAGVIEVYGDDGRYTGTKRIASLAPVTAGTLTAAAGAVVSADIWQLAL